MNHLASLITQRKEENGWTLQQIADQSGTLSRSTIHALVRKASSRRPPSTQTMNGLAKGLQVPRDVVYAAAAADAGYKLVEVGDLRVALNKSMDLQIIAAIQEELSAEQFAQIRLIVEQKAAEMLQSDQAVTNGDV